MYSSRAPGVPGEMGSMSKPLPAERAAAVRMSYLHLADLEKPCLVCCATPWKDLPASLVRVEKVLDPRVSRFLLPPCPLSWKIEKGPLPGPSQANLLPAAFPESANQPTPLLFSSYVSCPQASFGTYLDLLYFLYSVRDSATPLTVNLFEVKREGLSHQVQLSPAAGSCGRPLDEVCWSDFAKSTRRVLHKRFSCKGTLLNKFLGFFTE